MKILDEKYVLVKTLDSGASGSVKLAYRCEQMHLENRTPYAVKIYNDMETFESNKAEISVYQVMRHPNMTSMVEFNTQGQIVHQENNTAEVKPYIVLEFLPHKDLHDFICMYDALPEPICRYYFL